MHSVSYAWVTACFALASSCLQLRFLGRRNQLRGPRLRGFWEGDSLKRRVFALVVHDRSEPCQALKPVLRRMGVDTLSVSSCADAVLLLEQTHPHLVFTDTQLPDGTWRDLVNLADRAAAPTCVILVGPSKDPEMLQAALNHGAFSFICPPFDADAISQILNQALALVSNRREHRSRAVA